MVACNRYMAKGTSSRPPADAPAALKPTTVARRRRNQRASSAPILVREAALAAPAITNPETNIRNRIWKVRLSKIVASPVTTSPARITLRPPMPSKTLPRKGWVTPLNRVPSAAAKEMVVRFQPNSSLMGITNTPKLLRAPVVTSAKKTQVATMYQP